MPRLPLRVTTLVLSAFVSVGCASVAAPRVGGGAADAPMLGNQVSGAELTATGATNLYDALVRTRRQYFVARGVSTTQMAPRDDILVFRGGALMGEATLLKMLRPSDVRFVRRISAVDTYYKYGKSVSVGGLEIELVNE
jgi:hypothetical protein